MRSLLDAWCPEPHAAAITAAAWDRASGLRATADALGLIAVTPPDLTTPGPTWQHGAAVQHALALSPGGSLLAVGDDAGTIAVYRTTDGAEVLADTREGALGVARAMRGMAFAPDGERLATLAVDGRVRILNLRTGDRLAAFPDFTGWVVGWDDVGRRIVAIDHLKQPVVVDLAARQRIALPTVPGGAAVARFVPGSDRVIVLGPTGLYLVDTVAQAILASRTADRTSGFLDVVLSPDATRFAVISARSVHVFEVEGFKYLESLRHGAPEPSGVALWDAEGIAVAGADARLHRPDTDAPMPPTVCVAGAGRWRVSAHEHMLAVWQDHHRRRAFVPQIVTPGLDRTPVPLPAGGRVVEVRVDREGKLLAALPEHGAVHVYAADTGRLLFQAGDDTVDAPRMKVALGVVALLLPRGGMRWFDLRHNKTFELAWVQDFDVTGGGNWIAVITPKGRVRLLDPETGTDALPPLTPIGDAPVRALAFVEAQPMLLVLDDDGVLALYDLTPAARDGQPAASWRIAQIHDAEVDALWGHSDGQHATLRIQEPDGTATFATVNLDTGDAVGEVRGLVPYAVFDPIGETVLEPGRGSALLERDALGREVKVLRSLPNAEWVTFDATGIIAASGGARRLLTGRKPA